MWKTGLAITALAVALAFANSNKAFADEMDNGKPQTALTELLISDCAEAGYLNALDEDGVWTLRYINARVKSGKYLADLTSEERVVYKSYLRNYETFKEFYLYEMCKSMDVNNPLLNKHFVITDQ